MPKKRKENYKSTGSSKKGNMPGKEMGMGKSEMMSGSIMHSPEQMKKMMTGIMKGKK
jgi:hypothetical protein